MRVLELLAARAGALVVLDGALATELERDGYDLDDPLWSARLLRDNPEAIVRVHRRYIDAGADIVTTASYQATLPGLMRAGVDAREASALLHRAGELAARAREEAGASEVVVAGSLGPYGAWLADGSEYRGDYGLEVETLVDFHRPRMELVAASVDLLAFETIPDRREAEAIGRLLAEPGPKAWVSFSIAGPRTLRDGSSLTEAAEAVQSERLLAVGVNCCAPALVLGGLDTLRSHTSCPLVAYPNSGEGWDPAHHRWTGPGHGSEEIAGYTQAWTEAGAAIVGGCCRTTPALTRALAALRDRK